MKRHQQSLLESDALMIVSSLAVGVIVALIQYGASNVSTLTVHASSSVGASVVDDTRFSTIVNTTTSAVSNVDVAEITSVKNVVSATSSNSYIKDSKNMNVAGGVSLVTVKPTTDTNDTSGSNKLNMVVTKGEYNSKVPNGMAGCKSYNFTYMGYHKTTNVNSRQYKFLNSDECYTDESTGIRMVDGRYCIALGSYWTNTIGQKVDLLMNDGRVVPCVLGECKSDAHTDVTNRYHAVDGSVAEFIVDYEYFHSTEQYKHLSQGGISRIILVE